ncbi:MAG: aldo/keto reductase [Caulobacterales bacterium]|jgi:aryl-alcohol dehydrogenase-like predicted oxidoreductase
MRYKTLGPTGLVVSEICLGTMTFGGDGFWRAVGSQPQDQVDALLKAALEAGVNFFDTANVYSNGLSEEMLGQSIKNLGLRRDELVIATKAHGRVMPVMGPNASPEHKAEVERRGTVRNTSGLSRKHLFDAVDASLERLGMDFIDLYQVHGTDPLTPIEETLQALDDIVRSGRVRYIGLCNMAAWNIMKALGISERRGLAKFASCQMYYSIAGRDLEREVVPMALDQGLAILPWSPLAGGFLSGKFQREGGGPNEARRTLFDFPPVDKDRGFDIVDAMRPMGEARGGSPARIALAWLLHQRHVTSVIIGAKTPDQLADNLAATQVQLTSDELAILDDVSKLPAEYPGWMLERQGADRRGQAG